MVEPLKKEGRASEFVMLDQAADKYGSLIPIDEAPKHYNNFLEEINVNAAQIKDFLKAQKILEDKQFLKVVGHDPKGVMTYMIFGYRFENNDEFKLHINNMMAFINSRYVHPQALSSVIFV